jgi:hypothetical protein
MKKNEVIWRHLLTRFLDKKEIKFTQKELAENFHFSVSTVFNALRPLRGLGAVEVRGRDFRLTDFEKILVYWATHRQLKKEIVYQTYVEKPVSEIESEMVPHALFGAYSAWKFRYASTPADYDKVYVYAPEKSAILERFPKNDGQPANLIAWLADPWLKNYGHEVPLAQLFTDFWNLPEWYAKDFLNAAREKINIR